MLDRRGYVGRGTTLKIKSLSAEMPSQDLDLGSRSRVARAFSSIDDNYVKPTKRWTVRRRTAFALIRSFWYKAAMASVIICHLGLVAYETDLRAENRSNAAWLNVTLYSILALYVIEIMIQFYVSRMDLFQHHWALFDLAIVTSDIVCEITSMIFGRVRILAVLRVFRFLRFVRILRLFLVSRELYMIVHGLLSTFKAIFWASIICGCVLTMWSIVAVEMLNPINAEIAESGLYSTCERCEHAFSSVLRGDLTFVQQILAGDSWGETSVPIIEREPWTAFILIAVLTTVQFGLLNLIIAVIVDRAIEAREEDVEHKLREKESDLQQAMNELRGLCVQMDSDNSGNLTIDELQRGYDRIQSFRDMLRVMDIDKSEMATVLEIMDIDGSGEVSYEEFVSELHKMKTQESHTLLVLIRHQVDQIRKANEEQMALLKNDLLNMSRQHDEKLKDIVKSLGLTQNESHVPRVDGALPPENSAPEHSSNTFVTPQAKRPSSRGPSRRPANIVGTPTTLLRSSSRLPSITIQPPDSSSQCPSSSTDVESMGPSGLPPLRQSCGSAAGPAVRRPPGAPAVSAGILPVGVPVAVVDDSTETS